MNQNTQNPSLQQPDPQIQESTNPTIQQSTTVRRLGSLPRRKIAQLPEKTRDSINALIQDGLPLREITRRLRDTGTHINKDNLLRWKKTGYREWLKNQQRREDSHAKIRFLLSLVHEKKNTRILQAGQQIAAIQVADMLSSLDTQSLKQSFQDDPANYVRLLNALPRLSQGGLACDRLRAGLVAEATANRKKAHPKKPGGLSRETLRLIEQQVGLL